MPSLVLQFSPSRVYSLYPFKLDFYKGSVLIVAIGIKSLLVIFFELWTVGTLHCSRGYIMLPFCRQLVKTISRHLSAAQHHQACKTLERIGREMGNIRGLRQFKNIVLLGGVEKSLMAMKEVISLLGKCTH